MDSSGSSSSPGSSSRWWKSQLSADSVTPSTTTPISSLGPVTKSLSSKPCCAGGLGRLGSPFTSTGSDTYSTLLSSLSSWVFLKG
eukprot:3144918-Ditylum_brightwellii.AAC.1